MQKFYSHFDVKSPVEKCLEILMEARKEVDDNLMLKDIEWCMEMISSNKLYDPLIGFKNDEENSINGLKNNEVKTWIEHYSKTQQAPSKNDKNTLNPNVDRKSRRGSSIKNNLRSESSNLAVGIVPPEVIHYYYLITFIYFV